MSLPFSHRGRSYSPEPEPRIGLVDEAPILAALSAGDEGAFRAIFERYYSSLCSFAVRLVRSPDVAEDLVQEVFLDIWRRRETAIRGSARGLLFSAVHNAAMSHLRHAQVVDRTTGQVVALFDRPPVAPDRVLAVAEADAELQRAIANLPERCRLVFTLQREQGMSYAAIASTLGISPKTVDVQMGRALRSLRRALGPNWP